MAPGPRLGQAPRGVRADRAGRRLGRGQHAHDGRAPRRAVGDQRLEDVHHQRGDGHHVGRHHHRADGRGRDLEHRRRERDARLQDLGADEEARLAGLRHARAVVRGRARARGEPARAARRRVPAVPRDPRRRADLGRGDGRRARPGRVRPRVRVRAGAGAVRQADLVVPGRSVQARRHGDGDRGRTRARLQGRVAQGPGTRLRPRGGHGEALHRGALRARRRRRAPAPRRIRVHGGGADLAPLPGSEDPGDRRGDERGPAHGHRAAARACRRGPHAPGRPSRRGWA